MCDRNLRREISGRKAYRRLAEILLRDDVEYDVETPQEWEMLKAGVPAYAGPDDRSRTRRPEGKGLGRKGKTKS